MKASLKIACALLSLSAVTAFAGDKPHWGYSGEEGPENWGKLSAEYGLCGTGKNQSPINISQQISAKLSPIRFNYATAATEVLNNGHTVQANFAPGSTITVDGHSFELKQVHFHAPSENQVNGKSYPMEGHLVHADKDGNLAVVAVMFEDGKESPAIAKLWEQMPAQAGDKVALKAQLKAGDLLPKDRAYYRFNGSLTTPPCSEGVMWLVMKHSVNAGKEQVAQFAHTMHHPNNRPVQPANARPVLR